MLDPILHCPDPGVAFDEATHSYLVDGKKLPGVTTILKVVNPDQYAGIAEDVLQRASERGSNSHHMVALEVRDRLDLAALTGHLVPNYDAWTQFCFDFGFRCEYSELVLVSRKYGYCGIIDMIGQLPKHKRKPGRWQVDLKFTAAEPHLVGPQTAGYNIAACETIPGYDLKTPRGCLWIRGDQYRFIECNNPLDYAAFLSARTIVNWRDKQ